MGKTTKRTEIVKGVSFARKGAPSESSDVDIDADIDDAEEDAEEQEEVEVEEPPKEKKRKKEKAEEEEAENEAARAKQEKKQKKKQEKALAEAAEAAEEEATARKAKNDKARAKPEEDEFLEEAEPGLGKKERKRKKREALAQAAADEEAEAETSRHDDMLRKKRREQAEVEAHDESAADANKKEFTVYVSGIPWGKKESELREDFSKGDQIFKLNAPMNDQGKPRGIAFITYKSKAGVTGALKLDGLEYGGRTLSVKLADKAKQAASSKAQGKGKGKQKGNKAFEVFLCGLPFETDRDVLRKDFEECGAIDSFNMLCKSDGSCRGVAFITFKTLEGVEKACEFNGTEYGGRWIQVERSGEGKGAAKGTGKKDASKGENGSRRPDEIPASMRKPDEIPASMRNKHVDAPVEKTKKKTFDSDDE